MAEEWLRLFLEQQAAGFPDVRGARASLTLPVSDRLLSWLVMQRLPADGAVRELTLRAREGNAFVVGVRLTRPAFLPTINVPLRIERQPSLPADPTLVLRMEGSALFSLAGPALRFLNTLPAGIRVEGDLIEVNLHTLLERRGVAHWLRYVERLELATETGRVIVSLTASVDGPERS